MRLTITDEPSLKTAAARGAEVLHAGGLVAFPTETVYGLGADATNATAVARVFEAKERPHFAPLIVHLGAADWLERVVGSAPAEASRLAEKFWPGSLTLVLPKRAVIPDIVTAGLADSAPGRWSRPAASGNAGASVPDSSGPAAACATWMLWKKHATTVTGMNSGSRLDGAGASTNRIRGRLDRGAGCRQRWIKETCQSQCLT